MNGNVLVTGASGGIGSAVVSKFIAEDFEVYGFDIEEFPYDKYPQCKESESSESSHYHQSHYHHYPEADVCRTQTYPSNLPDFNYIVNCAGIQTDPNIETMDYDISVNLAGTIGICEKYAFQNNIKSVINIASASAHTGAEFAIYAASKGGVVTYTKSLAIDLADLYKARANSISPGGVIDSLNDNVMNDEEKWDKIMDVTPLKKWCEPSEIAEWVYFISVKDKSMTGQDILIDNGEIIHSNFVW